MKTPQLTGICFVTKDVLGLCAFYAQALGITYEGNAVHAVLHVEGGTMAVFSQEGMEEMAPGSTDGVGAGRCIVECRVENVDAIHERVAELAPVLMEPTTHPWGRRSAWYRDPDGNIITLYQVVV